MSVLLNLMIINLTKHVMTAGQHRAVQPQCEMKKVVCRVSFNVNDLQKLVMNGAGASLHTYSPLARGWLENSAALVAV